jgi:hypothetical protein
MEGDARKHLLVADDELSVSFQEIWELEGGG